MSVESNSGAADARATVTGPSAEVVAQQQTDRQTDGRAGASKGTPGDAKCVTEILGGDKNEVRGDKIYLSVLREN